MEIHVITAFPKTFQGFLDESILKRAVDKKIVKIYLHNFRDYANDKHKQIDDYPYGGGPGMILKPDPLFFCVEDVKKRYNLNNTKVILLTPAGETFEQKKAVEFSLKEKVILLCGHYKGFDQRIIDHLVDEELSIGDFILTGGELAAMCLIDAVVRLLPDAIGDIDSAVTDSFQSGLLDHPHYTRPEVFRTFKVPDILLSGNHKEIEKWRLEKALEKTKEKRIDLYNKYLKTENEEKPSE